MTGRVAGLEPGFRSVRRRRRSYEGDQVGGPPGKDLLLRAQGPIRRDLANALRIGGWRAWGRRTRNSGAEEGTFAVVVPVIPIFRMLWVAGS